MPGKETRREESHESLRRHRKDRHKSKKSSKSKEFHDKNKSSHKRCSVCNRDKRKKRKKGHWGSFKSDIMDVDLLRPGTVPISPDTSLWFEFLLDPNHLLKHLRNPFADPSPTELIIKFLTLSLSEKSVEVEGSKGKPSKKCQALKILALQVAAYLKWDIQLFETKLPMPLQATLLKNLLNVCSEEYGDVGVHNSINFSQIEPHIIFSIYIYHRWVVKSFTNSLLNGKSKPHNGMTPNDTTCEEVSETNAEKSYGILKNISSSALPKGVIIPSNMSFTVYSEAVNEVKHRWDLGNKISIDQFHCQLFMDMTNYLMFKEIYSEAKKALQFCCTAYGNWKSKEMQKEETYSIVTSDMIAGRCMALGITRSHNNPSLVQQFHKLVSEQYMNIEKLLEKDNLTKEIPLLYRDCLELDITSEIASGKITVYRDVLVQIQGSNMARRALEGGVWQSPKVTPSALQNALIPVIPRCTTTERERLKYLVGTILVNGDMSTRELMELSTTKELLSQDEINAAIESDYTDPIPEVLSIDLDTSLTLVEKHKSTSITMAAVERALTTSYDITDIETAVNKILTLNMNINVSHINRNWEIPTSLSGAITNLAGVILQQYIFVLLAKAYELDKIGNYSQAKALMRAAIDRISKEMTNQNTTKITQLISWEILLIEIHEFHAEWPAKHLDWSGIGQKCIQVLHKIEGCLPRASLRDECALTLLNTGQWTSLINSPQIKHSAPLGDLYTSIAAACEDINKYNKKITTDAWDKVLALFLPFNQKRREVPPMVTQSLCSIVELNAMVIVISILSKLHNVLLDQPQLELYVQLTQVWPNNVKNASQYSVKFVAEVLMDILDHSLKFAPNNVPWLKLKGDLHFAYNHYSAALRSYLEAVIAGTDYFTRPLHKNIIEDYIYKRMIKSCTSLQCYTQAGILCQFLDEVDYTTAYKSLSEGACNDSMDSYYDCIWDVNILEFLIHLHTKRGEHHRKQKVIRTIGLLELNSNNNDEIKRESENIRKGRFMRALTAQYLP